MKFFVTKYCLTSGIAEIEAEDPTGSLFPTMLAEQTNGLSCYYHGEGKDWHRTKEAAIARAEAMRRKKVESLKKKISDIEFLKFE